MTATQLEVAGSRRLHRPRKDRRLNINGGICVGANSEMTQHLEIVWSPLRESGFAQTVVEPPINLNNP